MLVDDSSTDDTVAKAKEYVRRHASMKLRVVSHQKVGGYDILGNYTRVLLHGYESLTKKPSYLAILDADTLLFPDYYELLLSAMKGNAKVGIAGGDLLPAAGTYGWWQTKRLLGSYPYVYGCNRVYRTECWDELIAKHDPAHVLAYIGIDTYHALLARVLGWQVLKCEQAQSLAMRPPVSVVRSTLKGISSYVLGYSLPYIVGRSLYNKDLGYLEGWLRARTRGLPRLTQIQPIVHDRNKRRILSLVPRLRSSTSPDPV